MATLSEFMPFILPLAPGCPAPLAELTLRDVATDFCSFAPIAQEVLDPIDIKAGEIEYDLDLPFGTDVTLILEAHFNGLPMGFFKRGDSMYRDHRACNAPYRLMQGADNLLWLDQVPTQDAPGAIVLAVATRPNRRATSVADVLLDYAYEIGAGTCARLMLMPGQLFSNPALAATYQAIYLAARTEARIRAEKSFGMATTGVRPRPFQ